MKPLEVNASEVFVGGTISIPVQVKIDWRYRLGVWLLKAAARVLRCEFVLIEQNDTGTPSA